MRLSEIPRRFRDMYTNRFGWTGSVSLIALGAVKQSNNPYFAVTEKNVENRVVRWFGRWPESDYSTVHVEREDGAVWSICLNHFETYERIDHVDPEMMFVNIDELREERKEVQL